MVAIVKKLGAERPVHVFVVGISRYRHLEDGSDPSDTGQASGLQQLSSAARSASGFAAWALENVPATRLESLYVNVAPAEDEQLHPAIQGLLSDTPAATRTSVVNDWEAFYNDCAGRREATVYIYVAGHGIQIGVEGAILLLEDFGVAGKPKLWAALDLVGMTKTLRGSEFPALQYWFIDCCREQADASDYDVAELQKPYVGFDVPNGLCRAAPVFFATFPRELAWARPGGVSLFNEGLVNALREEAATPPQGDTDHWCVTTSSLARFLNAYVVQQSGNLNQQVYISGHLGTTNEVLHEFATPPSFNLTVTLEPTDAYAVATADIDKDDDPVVHNANDWPLQRELPGGMYVIRINAEPEYRNATRAYSLTPQNCNYEVRLA